MKRFAIFGGRHYRNHNAVWEVLDALVEKHGRDFVLVHGACETGVDKSAARWATFHGMETDPHPAKWKEHGRAAGPMRNRVMANSGLDGAIGFPGGDGTADMNAQCGAAGVTVWHPMGAP